jgi:protocatechuate 3,4-dioxygenase beta subunit
MRNRPTPPGEMIARDWSVQPPALHPAYKTTVGRSPRMPLLSIESTLSEVTGPVFGHHELGEQDHDLIHNFSKDGSALGPRIIVHGRIMDELGRPVPNTLIEVWQANAAGRYRHRNDGYLAPLDPHFGGCGRCLSDDDGYYYFRSVRPGPYPWPNSTNSWRPAHIHFSLSGASFAQRLITQMYFEGDPLIPLCPILQAVPDAAAIDRLVARMDMAATVPMDSIAYRFDMVLRGRRSTLFENRLEGN